MDKQALVAQCKVPAYMANDRFESVTQTEFSRALANSARTLALSVAEITDIRDGRIARAELWAIIHNGNA